MSGIDWSSVGDWLKNNAGKGAALVGSLVTGNIPGAVAAGAAMIASAAGTDDPEQALAALKADPQTLVKLRQIAADNEENIRQHLEAMEKMRLEDLQSQQTQTQTTIRAGDASEDEYVRHTRPQMARQSWQATVAYCLGAAVYKAFTGVSIFDVAIATILSAPAWAYLGLRTGDKLGANWERVKTGARAVGRAVASRLKTPSSPSS